MSVNAGDTGAAGAGADAGGAGAGPGAGGAGAGNGGEAANAPWFADTQKEFVANKAWKNGGEAVDAYISLEKLLGADRVGRTVVMPKDNTDVEGMKAFRAKLGVPDAADGYELPLPKGDDGTFAKQASAWFHEAGVPKDAAQKIAEQWNKHVEALVTEQTNAAQLKANQALEGLKTEWGQNFDANSETARRGLRAFGQKVGLDEKDLTGIEGAIGTTKLLKMFLDLGKMTGEHGFVGSNAGGGNMGISVMQAREKVADITAKRASGEISDLQWKQGKSAELQQLHEYIASQGQG